MDVKIASKALANRVKKVIPKLIAVDQTAYVKGRFIGELIRVINDLIEHIEREGDEGILFSTDTEKAFDSVHHTFLFSTLEKFGFGFDFIKWIKTLLFTADVCQPWTNYVNNENKCLIIGAVVRSECSNI